MQLGMSADQAEIALRSMKTIATNNGAEPLGDFHRAALQAFQTHIAHSAMDLDPLEPMSPEDFAAAVPSPEIRRFAVHDFCFMAMADPDRANEDRLALVKRFAEACAIDAAIVTATRHAIRRQTVRLTFDSLRMLAPQDGTLTEKAVAMWDAVAPFLGVTNKGVAAYYQGLAALPEGTLGHAYDAFMTERNLKFPGERGGAPEGYFVAHDLTHILTGYGTDRDGEVEIIGYQAGYTAGSNPTEVMLLAFVQVQLGIVLDPVAPAAVGAMDFDRMLAAYARGTQATMDFTGGDWDYKADLDKTVEEVRALYNVVPR